MLPRPVRPIPMLLSGYPLSPPKSAPAAPTTIARATPQGPVPRSQTVHLRTATRPALLISGVLAAALALSACGSSSSPLASSSAQTSGAASSDASGSGSIVIGSGNFPESALIANIYAEALTAKGIDATTKLNIGQRAVYLKALQDGSIDLVPEYSGVLLQYFDKNATAVSSDDVYAALKAATPSGLTVLAKSTAENKDAVVVTKETADAHNLKSISDLAPLASAFVLGGPPEWATRPTGVPGLKEKYGLTFKEFKPLDVGGPLTVAALKNDTIQAGDLFTTDPAITANNFVVLEDPKNLIAAQNVLPLISTDKNSPAVTQVLDAVSAKLDTATLVDLNTKVSVDKEDSAQVAQEWVAANLPS
jgi:osmoprotectant transport system substrate-binding protein